MREEQQHPPQEKLVKVEWHVPDNIVSQYANNVFVQQGQYEFVISFFETRVPMIIGTPEEHRAQLMQLESIRAECVARIVVAPDLVEQIIQALQISLDTHQTTKREE